MKYKPSQTTKQTLANITKNILLKGVFPFSIFALVALGWCLPAFKNGFIFGTFDLALHAGIGKALIPEVHNIVAGDQARQDAVWANLNYLAVHSGRLPLWNPYSDLGLPELANFQSAPFSLPSLISYLFPLNISYTVIVIMKIIITGMGCYVLARVLRVSFALSILAGIAAELAGPTAAWAGWPQTTVAEWFCWLLACLILIFRKPQLHYGLCLALVTAFLIAGGFPEMIAILAIASVIFICAVFLYHAYSYLKDNHRVLSALSEKQKEPSGDILGLPDNSVSPHKVFFRNILQNKYLLKSGLVSILSVLLGALLSAPAWIPAIKVLSVSVSSVRPIQPTLPLSGLFGFIDPTWFGLPTSASIWFGPSNYYEMASFVGPLILIGALIGIRRRYRDHNIIALLGVLVILLFLAFGLAPFYNIAISIPVIKTIAFGRSLLLICPLLVILGVIGLEEIRNNRADKKDLSIALLMLVLWAGLGIDTYLNGTLSQLEKNLRLHGLFLSLFPLLGSILYIAIRQEHHVLFNKTLIAHKDSLVKFSIALMILIEAVVLIAASGQINTWSNSYLPQNKAISELAKDTKTALVALGGDHAPMQAPRLGIFPELNAAYQIRELAGYDAVTPEALDKEWIAASATPNLAKSELADDQTNFAPDITTLRQAKMFGVGYVLEPIHPPLRLVTNPRQRLSVVLSPVLKHMGKDQRNNIITGILDDIEWRIQQPLLARQFPATKNQFIYDYLSSLADGQNVNPSPPSSLGIISAQAIAASAKNDGAIQNELSGLVTRQVPVGFHLVATIGSEKLYKIPGLSGALLSNQEGKILQSLVYTDNNTAKITLDMRRSGWVSLAIDGESGWTAKTNGKLLATRNLGHNTGGLLQVRLPKGVSDVTLSYWPAYLTVALAAFFVALFVITIFAAIAIFKKIRLSGRNSKRSL